MFSELKSCQVAIECSIVIIDQYYENNHYYMQQCKCVKGSGDSCQHCVDSHVTRSKSVA